MAKRTETTEESAENGFAFAFEGDVPSPEDLNEAMQRIFGPGKHDTEREIRLHGERATSNYAALRDLLREAVEMSAAATAEASLFYEKSGIQPANPATRASQMLRGSILEALEATELMVLFVIEQTRESMADAPAS